MYYLPRIPTYPPFRGFHLPFCLVWLFVRTFIPLFQFSRSSTVILLDFHYYYVSSTIPPFFHHVYHHFHSITYGYRCARGLFPTTSVSALVCARRNITPRALQPQTPRMSVALFLRMGNRQPWCSRFPPSSIGIPLAE